MFKCLLYNQTIVFLRSDSRKKVGNINGNQKNEKRKL